MRKTCVPRRSRASWAGLRRAKGPQVLALQVLHGQDALARELGHHAGDEDVLQVGQHRAHLLGVLELEAIVRLAQEDALDLLAAGHEGVPVTHEAHGLHQGAAVGKVGPHRASDVRVLDLHRHALAALQAGAVHLTEGGGGEGLGLELGEQILGIAAELAVDVLAQERVVHRRRLEVQRLQGLGELARHEQRIAGEGLAQLHHRAAQVAHAAQEAQRGGQVRLVLEAFLLRPRGEATAHPVGHVACGDAGLQGTQGPHAEDTTGGYGLPGKEREHLRQLGLLGGRTAQVLRQLGDELRGLRVHGRFSRLPGSSGSSIEATNRRSDRSSTTRVSSCLGEPSRDQKASMPR